jgi:hypothetical protein
MLLARARADAPMFDRFGVMAAWIGVMFRFGKNESDHQRTNEASGVNALRGAGYNLSQLVCLCRVSLVYFTDSPIWSKLYLRGELMKFNPDDRKLGGL